MASHPCMDRLTLTYQLLKSVDYGLTYHFASSYEGDCLLAHPPSLSYPQHILGHEVIILN